MARAKKSKYEYVIGQIFGYVEPVEYIGKSRFRCICHRCGNETTADIGSLLNGKKKSCGCLKHRYGKDNPNFIDKTDRIINGNFRAIKHISGRHWEFECLHCGNHKVFSYGDVSTGKVKSCGCLNIAVCGSYAENEIRAYIDSLLEEE